MLMKRQLQYEQSVLDTEPRESAQIQAEREVDAQIDAIMGNFQDAEFRNFNKTTSEILKMLGPLPPNLQGQVLQVMWESERLDNRYYIWFKKWLGR